MEPKPLFDLIVLSKGIEDGDIIFDEYLHSAVGINH